MSSPTTPTLLAVGEFILGDILDEYSGKLDIHGQSQILISDTRLANVVKQRFPGEVGQWQPTFTFTSDLSKPDDSGVLQGSAGPNDVNLKALDMDSFTHAIISLNVEDGRAAFRMLKWVHWALVPKGLLIVVVPTKDTLINAAYSVAGIDRDEVMWQMTPARPPILDHTLRKASFEPSRIRILERKLVTKNQVEIDAVLKNALSVFEEGLGDEHSKKQALQDEVAEQLKADGGLEQEAYVMLARRWDQLSA